VDVSVIIPTLNRSELLLKTLYSLSMLDYPKDKFEIIVVDNNSTDETEIVTKKFIENNNKLNVSYYLDTTPGMLSGRHKGADVAKGEVLTFIDDDVKVSVTWMAAIMDAFRKYEDVDLVTGPCLPEYEVPPPNWLKEFWTPAYQGRICGWLSLMDLGDKEIFISPTYVWGLNYSIRKKTLYHLGGFHPDCVPPNFQQFQGDGETGLSHKAIKLAYKALYNPNVKLHHYINKERLTIPYFEKRAYYQGVANSYTHCRHQNNLQKDTTSSAPILSEKKNKTVLGKMSYHLMQLLKHGKNIVFSSSTSEINAIKKLLDKKQKEGFDFHQKEFKENEVIRNWVLKEDYWDYKLPVIA